MCNKIFILIKYILYKMNSFTNSIALRYLIGPIHFFSSNTKIKRQKNDKNLTLESEKM